MGMQKANTFSYSLYQTIVCNICSACLLMFVYAVREDEGGDGKQRPERADSGAEDLPVTTRTARRLRETATRVSRPQIPDVCQQVGRQGAMYAYRLVDRGCCVRTGWSIGGAVCEQVGR